MFFSDEKQKMLFELNFKEEKSLIIENIELKFKIKGSLIIYMNIYLQNLEKKMKILLMYVYLILIKHIMLQKL